MNSVLSLTHCMNPYVYRNFARQRHLTCVFGLYQGRAVGVIIGVIQTSVHSLYLKSISVSPYFAPFEIEPWFLLLHLLLSSDTITSLFELPTYTAMLCCKVGTYLYYGTFEQVWSYCFLIRAATKKKLQCIAPHRTAPHPTHCRVLLSGYPNQEIRWPYLFKGLIIIIVCSYFGDNSAT